jgi:hypothetical protein
MLAFAEADHRRRPAALADAAIGLAFAAAGMLASAPGSAAIMT